MQKEGEDAVATLLEASATPHERIFKPLDQQGPLESHALWGKVTAAIVKGEYGIASKLKTEIEEEQRAVRKQRKLDGSKFLPVHFEFVPATADNLNGATAQDATNHEQAEKPALGHWMLKE